MLTYSNYYIQLNNEESIITHFCNSFAATAVTGKICKLINKDYQKIEALYKKILDLLE